MKITSLTVSGVSFPASSAIDYSKNKVWSKNTGRTATGKMVGSIKVIKKKLEITYNYLTQAQIQEMDAVVSSMTAYHKVKFYDITENKEVEFTGYFGDATYPIYGYGAGGKPVVTGYKISIIEQ